MKSFEDLDCWKKSAALRRRLSSVVKEFPKDEKYRLVDQIVRASRSVTANNYLSKAKSESKDGRVSEPEALYGNLGSQLTINDHNWDFEFKDNQVNKPKTYYGRVISQLTINE